MPAESPYMTVAAYAERLSVSPRTIFRLIAVGLPSIRVGGSRRVVRDRADAWLARRTARGTRR
jgi:excisionase family DNA binding protein